MLATIMSTPASHSIYHRNSMLDSLKFQNYIVDKALIIQAVAQNGISNNYNGKNMTVVRRSSSFRLSSSILSLT